MLSAPEFPKFDYIMNNDIIKLTPAQVEWYSLLRLVDSFYFLVNDRCGLIQKTQGGYNHILLSNYLNSLAEISSISCDNNSPFQHDEFTKIAEESVYALNGILQNVRTKVIRETCNLHISKVREVTPQTIKWLAQRPQEDLADKIKPSNTVLTRRVVFSADTIENRTLKYFYNLLYRYITALIENTDCDSCTKRDDCELISGVNTFLRYKKRIRQSELANVPPALATVPNNALLCDKFYNVIWRSTVRLRNTEDRMKETWAGLPAYLTQLRMLIKAIMVITANKGKVIEQVVTYKDAVGVVNKGDALSHINILCGTKDIVTISLLEPEFATYGASDGR